MAAFTIKEPSDRGAFDEHWKKVISDSSVLKKKILYRGEVAGHIGFFDLLGLPSVGYWIGKNFWNLGIATAALKEFVSGIKERPIYARVAALNKASIRVLEKCGFARIGVESSFSEFLRKDVEELVMKLAV